jgi:hypothetical protein
MLEPAKVNDNIKNGEEPSTGGLSDDIHGVLARVVHRSVAAKARSASVLPKRIE